MRKQTDVQGQPRKRSPGKYYNLLFKTTVREFPRNTDELYIKISALTKTGIHIKSLQNI